MFERGRKDNNERAESPADESQARPARGARTTGATSANTGDVAVIGRSIKINGDLSGDEDLRIEGNVAGTVELRNHVLTIGKEGRIKADVYAKIIVVDGQTDGDLFAAERISINANARVLGNVTAPRVGIEDGAKFKGSIEMDQAAVDKALGTSSKPTSASTASKIAGQTTQESKLPGPVKEVAAS